MKPIKKFSMMSKKPTSILESSNLTPEAIDELVKKLGYDNLDEVKKEKALLSKLEALIKEFNPKQDVSEDDSDDIEDEVLAKGEPKSLEAEEGKKEEDKEVGGEEIEEEEDSEIEDEIEDGEDDEDESDEIEDEENEEGEPEDADDSEEVEIDAEITDDVPADTEDSAEEAKTKRRIKTFEEYTMESEETINKNVKYTDDEDEKEDYAMPVAEAVNASGYIKAGKLGYNDQFRGRQSLSRTLSLDLGLNASDEFVGPWIGFDHVSMYVSGKNGGTILDDALTGKYTYDELKAAAAKHMGIKESAINEYSDAKVADMMKGKSREEVLKSYDFAEDNDNPRLAKAIKKYLDNMNESTINEAMYSVIDGRGNLLGSGTKIQANADAKKRGGKKSGFFVILTKNAKAGRRAIEKANGNFEDSKLQDTMMDLYFESAITEGKDDYMARYNGTNINLKKGYKHHTEDELEKLYTKIGELVKDDLKVKDVTVVFESSVNEAEVKSPEDFKEYATAILKDAHGEDYDEAKATEVIDGLLSKYKEDFGAMVGALQSSMGK